MRRRLGVLCCAVLAFSAAACQGNVFSLKVGDCFNGTATGTVTDVSVTDCAKPHDAEVISSFSYPNPPADLPDDTVLRGVAETQCRPDFQSGACRASHSPRRAVPNLAPCP